MAIRYPRPKDAYDCVPNEKLDRSPEGAEQEHKDSCDINKMLRNAARGIQVRGNSAEPVYGYDDTTLDGVTHRINKQNLERELKKTAETAELSEEELKLIPESIKKQFGFKAKKVKGQKTKNDDLNDENSTKGQKTKKATSQTEDPPQEGQRPTGRPSERDNASGAQS